MPYKRSYRRPRGSKRTYRRKTTRGQRRFRRKRFSKQPVLRASTVPPTMLIKLQYSKLWQSTINTSDQWSSTVTNGLTYPTDLQPASMCFLGSHCCTPLGDSIRPASFGSMAGTISNVVEDAPIGLQNWGTFYTEGICFGSSITITMYPTLAGNLQAMKYVLFPIATQNQVDIWQPNSQSTASIKYTLDQLSFQDLTSYPGARTGYIRDVGAGPTRVKMFRKTKSLLGLRDIKDNQYALSMLLPNSSGASSNTTEANPDTYAAAAFVLGWVWYFRVFILNTGASTVPVEFTTRIKYYAQLSNRKQFTQAHYPA